MSLIALVIMIIVICLLYWALVQIMTAFALEPRVQVVARVIFVLIVCLFLLQTFFGVGPFLDGVRLR
jgi:hypothetical protein